MYGDNYHSKFSQRKLSVNCGGWTNLLLSKIPRTVMVESSALNMMLYHFFKVQGTMQKRRWWKESKSGKTERRASKGHLLATPSQFKQLGMTALSLHKNELINSQDRWVRTRELQLSLPNRFPLKDFGPQSPPSVIYPLVTLLSSNSHTDGPDSTK